MRISEHAKFRYIKRVDRKASMVNAEKTLRGIFDICTLEAKDGTEELYRYPYRINGKVVYMIRQSKDDTIITVYGREKRISFNKVRLVEGSKFKNWEPV
jgi:hypothetical protein